MTHRLERLFDAARPARGLAIFLGLAVGLACGPVALAQPTRGPEPAPSPPPASANPATPAGETAGAAPAGSQVSLHGTDLFTVQARLGSLSPAERAELANRKLAAALRDPQIGPEHVVTVADGDLVVIEAGPLRILEVGPADAAAHDSSPPVLAELWANLIRTELDRQKRESFSLLLIGRWLGRMLYPAATLVLLWIGSIVLDRLAERLRQRPTESLPVLSVLGIALLGPLAVRRLLQRLLGLGRAVLYLGLGYAFLAVVFAQFPRTRAYAWDMLVFVTGILGGGLARLLDWFPPLAAAVVLFFAARLALKLNGLLFARVRAGRAPLPSALVRDNLVLTEVIIRALIILATLVLLAILIPGEGGQTMLAALFLVLLVGALALGPPARQAAAGLLLAYIRAARTGARVEVDGTRGTVVRRDLLHTILRTDEGVEIWVPHQQLLDRRVIQLAPPSGGATPPE